VRNEDFDALRETMKKAAASLRESDVPFLLGGGLACWARGGPETDHDLDFMVKPEDAERAQEALVAAGMRPEKPPEDWLLKAYDSNDVLVDIIFRPTSGPITEEVLARGEEREVDAVRMRLMALEDILVTKLLALSETHLDYESVLQIARPLREQIDWDEVRERTKQSPYARGFFALAEELEILERPSAGGDGDAR
jgi:predicted nucleotidyltransferase